MNRDHYMKLQRDSTRLRESKDCTVIAVGAVTGSDYKVAHHALNVAGRIDRRGCAPQDVHRALWSLGYEVTGGVEKSYPWAKTVMTCQKVLPRAGSFLIYTATHVAAWVDGQLLDWTAGRKHRVESIYWVTQRDR